MRLPQKRIFHEMDDEKCSICMATMQVKRMDRKKEAFGDYALRIGLAPIGEIYMHFERGNRKRT
jgi:hypothetical protein